MNDDISDTILVRMYVCSFRRVSIDARNAQVSGSRRGGKGAKMANEFRKEQCEEVGGEAP